MPRELPAIHRWFRLLPCRLAIALAPMAACAADPADTHPGLNLIPWPKALDVQAGWLPLGTGSRIVADGDKLRELAAILAEEIRLLTSLQLPVAGDAPRAGDIVLKINPAIRAGEPILVARPPELVRTTDGAHTVAIGDQAVVEGFDYRAVAEGTATLLQALRQADGRVALPRLTIKDWPHADYCGMMVDCGRQNQPLEWLKKMVVTCRFYKVRYLHLHLTDDHGWTFPSTKYPQLGSRNFGAHGGVAPAVYTLGELTDLVAFADARGIAIVPELELPGHSGAALRSLPAVFDAINPATGQPVGMGCMNMASEEIYPALDTIIGEMCDVFRSSPYFHIGSDEVSMGRVSLHSGYQAFMDKHGLKNDGELANHFIRRVNEMVKRRGKKTIKWEGLANAAAKDIVIMAWDSKSNTAGKFIADGFATITCPWNLEVPWEQWNMYECNGSKLKRGDAVLGATLVAWEQSAETHAAMVRGVASRQERTWGPDTTVTEPGFAARFQPLDAAVGKLTGLPPKPVLDATFAASAGTRDLLEPVLAFDGKDATFHQSAAAPNSGDHFTIELASPSLVHAVEVLTGVNGKGLIDGAELQVAAEDGKFVTVARLAKGSAKAVLRGHRVKALRVRCAAPQNEPMVVREIKLQRMIELAGVTDNPGKTIGEGNFGVITADTTFRWATGQCLNPVINNGFTLTFDSGGGNACGYNGPVTGTGTVEILQGGADGNFRDSPLVLGGSHPNTMQGTWRVKAGRLTLAKDPGVDAAGGTIIVGGQGDNDCLLLSNSHQVNDAAAVELLDSPRGGATFHLNGCEETIASLKLAPRAKVVTDGQKPGGVLFVGKLSIGGKTLPGGLYTAAEPWIEGSGFVAVGGVKQVSVGGAVDNANTAVGPGNIANLTAATTFGPATGNCSIPVRTGAFDLTIRAPGDKPVAYGGFITGNGNVTFDAAANPSATARQPLEIAGTCSNSHTTPTLLAGGVLKLNKRAGAIAVPVRLNVGGDTPVNSGDTVVLGGDGQFAPTAILALNGKSHPCCLDLAGHKTTLGKVLVDGQARIRTGNGGSLTAKQILVDGKKIAAGTHRAPLPWLEGGGTVTVDPRVDAKGRYGNPNDEIGAGNIANLTGDTEFWVGVGNCDIDVVTNGHTITFDSGDGNALCHTGTISGTGDVVLLMGPSHTGFKDAPLRLAGEKPNTTSGRFLARKGRVQLEKPAGVDAISGDVIVGGQGFNDCLHWIHDNQIKDTATVTLLDAGNNGAAYLSLNGCRETVAALVMAANATIKTDNPDGQGGVLTAKSLTVGNEKMPPGTYTAASAKWLTGKGSVVVAP